MWFSASAIASEGLAGLFLLAFLSRRANRSGVFAIVSCVVFSGWAFLTNASTRIVDLGAYNYPWNDLTIGAIGNIVFLVAGYVKQPVVAGGHGDDASGDVVELAFGVHSGTLRDYLKSRRFLARTAARTGNGRAGASPRRPRCSSPR